MKSLFKNAIICSSLLFVLAACSEEKKDQFRVTVSQQMDSNQLADAGEQLMMPQSLHLANKVFEMALAKDPENKKAQLYKVLLERVMIMEGVLTRIQPYVDQYGDKELFAKNIKEIPNHPVRGFLLTPKNGATKIKTLADIQALFLEYRKAAENFREFIVKNQDLNLDLYINPYLFQDVVRENQYNSCTITEKDNTYDVVCDNAEIARMRVNMADMLVLKQMAAGDIIYASLYTSYSVGSIESLIKADEKSTMDGKAIMDSLENTKDFGHLMKTQGLTAVRKLGSDFAVGMKWAIQYQSNLCKIDEYGRPVARKGFLMKDICTGTDGEAQRTLQTLEGILAGQINTDVVLDDGTKVPTTLDVMALLDKPVGDVRSLMPSTWNDQGTLATTFRDPSLGGLFPKQDANILLKNNR